MSCTRCPCPDICLGWPPFCAAAAKEPQEPVEIKHICARSQGIPRVDYPLVSVQARNLWASLKGLVKSGGKLAPKPERARRLAICLGCEHYDQAQKRCRVCGCANSAKVWLASDSCPLETPKWTALTGG